MPWWAAIVIAVTGVAVGFAFDAGSGKDLTIVFAGLYVLGCVAAVLAVQQAGVFTAVIQPPLILFVAVPGAYFLFHGAKFTGVKDLVINCGYPLIERFPLMLLTSAGVLLIGLIRWLLGRFDTSEADVSESDESAEASDTADSGRVGVVAKLVALFNRDSTVNETPDRPTRPRPRREHAVERSARPSAERRNGRRPAAGSTRTRRPRPPIDDDEPTRDRARRRRPAGEFDASEPPRRSSRQPRDPEQRGRPSRDVRRDPAARRARSATRSSSRFDAYEPAEPLDAPAPRPRRRPSSNGAGSNHHPISQVRYRASGGDEPGNGRPRRPRKPSADWDFDD